jgi:hypothetical protein
MLAKLFRPTKEQAEAIISGLMEKRQILMDQANDLDAGLYLDDEPARLEPPSMNSRHGLWVVRSQASEHWTQFSERIVELVVSRGGRFHTPELRRYAAVPMVG